VKEVELRKLFLTRIASSMRSELSPQAGRVLLAVTV